MRLADDLHGDQCDRFWDVFWRSCQIFQRRRLSSAMNSFAGAHHSRAGMDTARNFCCNRGDTLFSRREHRVAQSRCQCYPSRCALEEGAFATMWGGLGRSVLTRSRTGSAKSTTMAAIRNSSVAMISHTKLLEGQAGTEQLGPAGNLLADALVLPGLVPPYQERSAQQCLLHVQRGQRLRQDLVGTTNTT